MLHIGTDIIEISRIRAVVARFPSFYGRILTTKEKEHAKKGDPSVYLAGRFAAKEAVMKCMGTGLRGLSWHDMEIIPDASGVPLVFFSETARLLLRERRISSIKVSIAHSREYAMAVAVGEGCDDEAGQRLGNEKDGCLDQ